MLDPKLIESNPSLLKETLLARGFKDMISKVDEFVSLRKKWRQLKTTLDNLRHERNVISLAINEAVKKGNKDEAEKKKTRAKEISTLVKKTEDKTLEIEKKLFGLSLSFPNILSEIIKENKIVEEVGEPKKESWHKDYEELCKKHDLIDFDTATNISGTGFYILKDKAAKLERALINLFLDIRRKQNYKEISPPILVTEKAMINSGQLPKFKDDMFLTQEGLYLIPTAEVSLLNLYAHKTFRESELPIYVTALTPCFRIERGATKGFVRVKQFYKVELFKFTTQEDSEKELDKMIKDACETLRLLNIPFRVKLLSSEEVSFASAKTYDIEAYSPVTGWLEVSSCSNCTDFQSRRARIKYITKSGEKKFVHTLNGSGLAIPRTFISIIENYQQKNGSIKIPEVLHPYLDFKEIT